MTKNKKRLISLFILVVLLLPSLDVRANEVDYNNLLTDEQAQDYNSMSQVQIKNFLVLQGSTLANYWYIGNNPAPSELAIDPEADYFKQRSAAEIIYNAAQEAKINPKFLLALLQKEQSLIEDKNPTQRQYDFATGYFCYDGQACNPRYKGFGKQVRSAALQFRYYLDSIHEYNFQPGKSSVVDGELVVPENRITAAMYVYTPHLHGNKLFATLWNRYDFGTTVAITNGIFPDGSLVSAKDGEDTETVYLIHSGRKLAFDTKTALVSRYNPNRVLKVSAEEIAKYEDGNRIKFPNYSVLEDSSGNRYLIDGLIKRQIESDEAFRQLGYNPAEVLEVSDSDLDGFYNGIAISETNVAPLGELWRDPSSGGVFYVKDDQKAPIIHPDIIKINFPDLKVQSATASDLDGLTKVLPVKLEDGILIKLANDPRVYVISNGSKRLVPNEETFVELGYSWSNIYEVSERVFDLHRIGSQINL